MSSSITGASGQPRRLGDDDFQAIGSSAATRRIVTAWTMLWPASARRRNDRGDQVFGGKDTVSCTW